MPRISPPRSTTAIGTRSSREIVTPSGQWRVTSTARTTASASTRARMASRSTRASGSPVGTAAAVADLRVGERLLALDAHLVDGQHRGEVDEPQRTGDEHDQQGQRPRPGARPASGAPTAAARTAGGCARSPGRGDGAGSPVDAASVGVRGRGRGVTHRTSSEQRQHPRADLGDVAGAEGEHEVAGTGPRDEGVDGVVEVGDVGHPRRRAAGRRRPRARPVTAGSASSRAR